MSPPARSPSFPQVLALMVRGALEDVHTSMPGRIESFDKDKCVADVQPTVDQQVLQEDGTIIASRFAVLRNVPVVFPGGGGYRITFPVAAGDYCELVCQESSIDRWRSNGGLVDPQDTRRFHLSDAICRVGLRPNGSPWTGIGEKSITIGKDGGPQVVAREQTIELGGDDSSSLTESGVLGDKQKGDLDSMLQSASQSCTNGATALTTAVTAMTTACAAITSGSAGLHITPLTPVGIVLDAVNLGLISLTTQLSSLGAQLTAMSTAFSQLKGKLSTHLSGIVKLK